MEQGDLDQSVWRFFSGFAVADAQGGAAQMFVSKYSCAWRSEGGPISALRMSLVRLGRAVPNFIALRGDKGQGAPLGIFSPSLVAPLVKDGYFRMLERDSGTKRGFFPGYVMTL